MVIASEAPPSGSVTALRRKYHPFPSTFASKTLIPMEKEGEGRRKEGTRRRRTKIERR